MITPAPDLVFRRRNYRLAEPYRTNGVSVRPVPGEPYCTICGVALREARMCVRMADRLHWLDVACAIDVGFLVDEGTHR